MLQKPGCNSSDEFLVPAQNSVENSASMTLDTRKKSVTYKIVIMTVIKKLEYTQSNSFYFWKIYIKEQKIHGRIP